MVTPNHVVTGESESFEEGLTLKIADRLISINKDGFSIGTSPRCDLVLDDPSIGSLHSVIHLQAGAVWIETANDQTTFECQGRAYRRMALRHEDLLQIGSIEVEVLAGPIENLAVSAMLVPEDLSQLNVEQLCDRIIAEQGMVDDFIRGQRSGWDALIQAITQAHAEPMTIPASADSIDSATQSSLNTLLEQIQEINDTLNDRQRELAAHENVLIDSEAQLEATQQNVNQRIEAILNQLNVTDPPTDLRASA